VEKRFVLDGSLGKLAKWLRILGFDALYRPGPPDATLFSYAKENRILLTRAEKIRDENPGAPLIFIHSNNPGKQLRQVVEETDIRPSETKPFSRCVRCNVPVVAIDREKARGKVPDYVFETRPTFRQCPLCERIYWSGTHLERASGPIRRLFEP
jgi:uncharacterized protein